jgi:hypothetical protein
LSPTHLTFLCFPELKLKGHHFDAAEIMEAELQTVLNTLTDAFKKWQKCWERCICAEGNYVEGDGGQ